MEATNKPYWALQVIEEFAIGPFGDRDANECLAGLRKQDGFLGGRILAPSPSNLSHRVQAFFQDEPEVTENGAWLPDGVRRVILPGVMLRQLGIER